MTSHYSRVAPTGHSLLSPPAAAGYNPKEPLADWEILFQFNALIEQRARLIAREEFQLLLAAHTATAVEADNNEQLITVAHAAEILGVISQTVYEWIKAGKIPSFTIGSRSVRLKRGDVLAALQARTQPNGRRKYARRQKKEVAYA